MTTTDHSEQVAGAAPAALRLVNGVFKGGGAKGIAYAGALTAMRERGLWFRSVAGASAGAITAALIAAGMQPDELEAAVPEGLAATRAPKLQRIGKAIIGHATSVFESSGLRSWLDTTLAARIGKTDGSPVTFAELYAATGIELYVVAMDLSNGLPVVFCRRTTPLVEVAGAVTSSSAIPGAFPPGRGVFSSPADGAVVHQFVDGGTWANYPSFVFQDRSFRAWLRAATQALGHWTEEDDEVWRQEAERPVVGFILGEPAPLERRQAVGLVPLKAAEVNRRFDQGPTYTSPQRGTYLMGAVLSSDWARLFVGLAMAVWVALSLATLPIAVRRFSTWLAGWAPDVVFPLLLVATLSLVAVAAVVAIGLVVALVLVGRLIADTLVPSVKALVGVPTDVAPWIGMGDDCVVLQVPHEGLATTDFAVTDAARTAAVAAAHGRVGAQLDDPVIRARLDALFDGVAAPPERLTLAAAPPLEAVTPDRVSVSGVVAAVAATALIGGLGWWGANSASTGGIGLIVLAVLIGLLGGGVALLFVGGRAGVRSSTRSRFGVADAARPSGRVAAAAMAAGAALVALGAVLSIAAMSDRADDTTDAKVISAQQAAPGSDDNIYVMQFDGADVRVALLSDRHLRLGEHVFVQFDEEAGTARLVGALDDGRFAIAVVCWMLGIGLITSGVRRRNWDTRCVRLGTLLDDWNPGRAAA